jgi:hypothetical protein
MTILTPMPWLQQYQQFETSSFRLCHIHLAVPNLHHATFMPLDHLQGHYVVAILDVIDTSGTTYVDSGTNKNLPL